MNRDPGIGATDELSLRVSVATLVRVVFKQPLTAELMLVLERKATLRKSKVEIKSQPFGGAVQIRNVDELFDIIGDFQFDSARTRSEQDFRLFIKPSSWETVRRVCVEHFDKNNNEIFETDPARELAEEFAEALKIELKPEQYVSAPVATVIEDEATPTDNVHAEGIPTVRVYRIFEAVLVDSPIVQTSLTSSMMFSDQEISEHTLKDARDGGAGRFTSILILPFNQLKNHYLKTPSMQRNFPTWFEGNQLDETVTAVLDQVIAPKYKRLNAIKDS